MNSYVALPVFFIVMSFALSGSGAPQSPGSFQFIKKDGKVINAFGNVPSNVDKSETKFVSPNRGSPCVDSSCRFSQFVNPPVTRTENPVSSSTTANVVQNTSVPKASNTAPVFSSNAAPVFVSTPSRSVQNNPEPVRSQGTSQSSRVKSSFPRTQPARSLDGK